MFVHSVKTVIRNNIYIYNNLQNVIFKNESLSNICFIQKQKIQYKYIIKINL